MKNLTDQQLADLNTSESLNEYWSRQTVKDGYFIESRMKLYEALVNETSSLFASESLKILDAGCGPGRLIKSLLDVHGDHIEVVVGIDYAQSALDWTEEYVDDQRVITVCADITQRIPYTDDYFDYSFIEQSLEHITEWKNALSELLRVTKDKVIITIPDGSRDTYSAHINHWSMLQAISDFKPFGLESIDYFPSPSAPYLIVYLGKE